MKIKFIFFYLLSILILPSTVSATSLRPVSLEQLSQRASLIFYGTVISNEVKKDGLSGQVATFTQFQVLDLIKGKSQQTHTIKQIGGQLKDNPLKFKIHGVPEFTTGNDYVIFLPKKSKLGFSSPLGLHQGLFSVLTRDGEKIIINANKLTPTKPVNNMARKKITTMPLAVDAQNPGQANLTDFSNVIRAYAAEQ